MGQLARVEDDFEASMFVADELPEFNGESLEDHQSAWIAVQLVAQREHWRLAAIAHSLQDKFGADSIKDFASAVGLKASTIYHYARTYRRFSLPECQRWQTMTFSAHMIAAYQKTPEDTNALLKEADSNKWSAETMREHVRRESFKKSLPDSINPDDAYDRQAWERGCRPALYRFIAKSPKFRRQVVYLISEIDNWFKLRATAPIEIVARVLREGCETLDLIAEETHMAAGAVEVLLGELVAAGKVRAEKELKVTEGARGATRTRYQWIQPVLDMYIEDDIEDGDDDDE